MRFSIVILYFNRTDLLRSLVADLLKIQKEMVELIVVDNHSDEDLSGEFPADRVRYLRLDENRGAVARNYGMRGAAGEFIICLDDDIVGISGVDLEKLARIFQEPSVAGVCFKVLNPRDKTIMNWCHHYDLRIYAEQSFDTNQISEGAVAFRASALSKTGLYFEPFFISHEGPDLACRIINSGLRVVYSPEIVVEHHHSDIGRKSWRRYYYDTRNLIWLNIRNYPFVAAAKRILIGAAAMFVYSARDGFLKYWVKAVVDGIAAYPEVVKDRAVLSTAAIGYIKEIESHRPNLLFYISRRLLKRKVQI